jgi:hypothetical protein
MKNIPATIGTITELEEKGCQQATEIALGVVIEMKVMIGNQGPHLFPGVLDIIDNGRADDKHEHHTTESDEGSHTKLLSFPHPLGNRERY